MAKETRNVKVYGKFVSRDKSYRPQIVYRKDKFPKIVRMSICLKGIHFHLFLNCFWPVMMNNVKSETALAAALAALYIVYQCR